MTRWTTASFDDWVVVYKDGVEHFQHHHPDWRDVFSWLGAELDDRGEFDSSDFDYHFPDSLSEFEAKIDGREERERLIVEKEAEIQRLRSEIFDLGGMA